MLSATDQQLATVRDVVQTIERALTGAVPTRAVDAYTAAHRLSQLPHDEQLDVARHALCRAAEQLDRGDTLGAHAPAQQALHALRRYLYRPQPAGATPALGADDRAIVVAVLADVREALADPGAVRAEDAWGAAGELLGVKHPIVVEARKSLETAALALADDERGAASGCGRRAAGLLADALGHEEEEEEEGESVDRLVEVVDRIRDGLREILDEIDSLHV